MSDALVPPHRLGYVALAVKDLAEAVSFWTRQLHLSVTHAGEGIVYLSGGRDHHWIVLQEAPEPGLSRLAYEYASASDLAAARGRLEGAGIATRNAADRGITEAFDCADPDGLPLRLFFGMAHHATPRREKWVNHAELLHVGLSVSNVQRSYSFYNGLLGLKASDWVESMGVFLRSGNGYHHALVLLERGQPRLEHICFQLRSFDDLMRARELLLSSAVALKTDLIRHAPSSSVAIYTHAVPAGVAAEMCIWHERVAADHAPRMLVRSPWAHNQWVPPADLESWR